MPVDEGQFFLDTDACDLGIGAVLSQVQDGEERVLVYASRSLSKTERNYCATRKELLAVVFYLKQFRCYLLGRHVVIRTDHAALRWLKHTPEPIGQQARWLEIMEEFDYEIVHRPGKQHQNADALSRVPCRQCGWAPETGEIAQDVVMDSVQQHAQDPIDHEDQRNIKMTSLMPNEKDVRCWDLKEIASATMEDVELKVIYHWKQKLAERPGPQEVAKYDEKTKIYWQQWGRLLIQDDVLYRRFETPDGLHSHLQIIPPRGHREALMLLAHTGITGGHLGITKTKGQVLKRAYWVGWGADVERFCRSCEECARYHRGGMRRRGPLQEMLVGNPGERISIDITGPHPTSSKGNKFILTVIDHFTKFAEGYAIRNHEALTVAKTLMMNWIVRYGAPIQILSDRGGEFEGHLYSELCRMMEIDKCRTTSYKPSTNAVVERFHRTLNCMIGKIVGLQQRDWDEKLPMVLAAYRSTIHESTGYSPNFLVFGRENRAPLDLVLGSYRDSPSDFDSYDEHVVKMQEVWREAYAKAREVLKKCAVKRKKYYDLRVKPEEFVVGQWVWYFCPKRIAGRSPKWQKLYDGPFLVVRKIDPVNVVLQKTPRTSPFVVHIDKIKPYYGTQQISWLKPEGSGETTKDKKSGKEFLEDPTRIADGAADPDVERITFEKYSVGRPKRNCRKPIRFQVSGLPSKELLLYCPICPAACSRIDSLTRHMREIRDVSSRSRMKRSHSRSRASQSVGERYRPASRSHRDAERRRRSKGRQRERQDDHRSRRSRTEEDLMSIDPCTLDLGEAEMIAAERRRLKDQEAFLDRLEGGLSEESTEDGDV